MRNRISKHLLYCLLAIALVCLAYSVLLASSAQAAELKLPSGLKRIEAQAFYGDTSLDTVTIQEGTEVIGKEAFKNSSVQTITLPGSLYSIGEDAFSGCENLTVNAQEGTYAYTWAVTNKYINIPDGEAGAVTQVIAPETLRAGADLTIQIIGPADTIHHSIYVVNERTEEYQIRESTKARTTVSFDGYKFESGDTYRLTVYTVTREYLSLTPVRKTFQVTGQKPTTPEMALPESIRSHQYLEYKNPLDCDLYMIVDYLTTEGVLVSSEKHFIDPDSYISSNIYDELSENGGLIHIRYTAYIEGLWSEWSAQHIIQVTMPQFLIDNMDFPNTIDNGRNFSVHFDYIGCIDYCSCHIMRDEISYASDSTYLFNSNSGTVDFYISSLDLIEGSYSLDIYLGFWEDERTYLAYQHSLEVIGTREPAPMVSPDSVEVFYGSPVTFTISSANMDCINAITELPDGDTWHSKIEVWGTKTEWETYPDWYTGSYKYRFAALSGEKWTAWSDPIEIIVRERQTLDSPNVYISTPITAGKDWNFTFEEVENATHYSASLKSPFNGNVLYTLDPATPTDLQEIPGYALSSGSYLFEVNASADDYTTSSQQKSVSIVGSRPAAPIVTVAEPICAGQTVKFSFDTTDVDALQIQYIDNWYDTQNIRIPVTGDTTEWSYHISQYWQNEPFTVSYSARINGVWSVWKKLIYTVDDLPPLAPAVIHVDETIPAGKDFSITVDDVENATHYEYYLYLPDGRTRRDYVSSIGLLRFYGYDLEPGIYTLKVSAYSNDYSSSESEITFTITGNKQNGPEVSVNKTEVFDSEYYTFTIDTVTADALICKCNNLTASGYYVNYNVPINGDTTEWSTYRSPSLLLYRFSVLKNGTWSAWSEPITINVKEKPPLAEPEIYTTGSFLAGNDLIFSFDAVDNATRYDASFRSEYDGSTLYSWGSDTALPETELCVPGYLFSSGSYILSVAARSSEYNDSSKSIYITVNGRKPAGPVVTVNEPPRIKRTSVFTIDTENADALQVKYQYKAPGYYWSEVSQSIPVTGTTTQWEHQIPQDRQGVNLTVSFSTKTNGVWTAWSTNTYTIESLPPLAPAVIHVDDIIEAGKDFSIIVDAVENAASYQYVLYFVDDNNVYYDYGWWYSSPNTLVCQGYSFAPGIYAVKVLAYSDGYSTSESVKTFTITGNKPSAPNVQVDKTDVKAQEYYTFTIDTNGSEALMYRLGNGSPYSIAVLENETQWTTYSYYAEVRKYSFSVRRNGIWSAWSEPKVITITDYAPLDEPEITVSSPLISSKDLIVSLTTIDNSQSYEVNLWKLDGTVNITKTIYPGNELIVLFPGYRLPAGAYRISAYAYDTVHGFTISNKAYQTITLAASDKPAAPAVTPPENANAHPNSYITFTIDSTDADMIAARYFEPGYTNDVYYSTYTVREGQNETACQLYYIGASRKYSFAVRKNGIWSEWSSFTTITAAQNNE